MAKHTKNTGHTSAGSAAKSSAAAGRTAPRAAAPSAGKVTAPAPAPEAAPQPKAPTGDGTFDRRLARHYDEMKWLYCELYHGDEAAFDYFTGMLRRCYDGPQGGPARPGRRRGRPIPDWYRRSDLLGMMLYTGAFAGTLKGVEEKLPYIQECGVNYLHLMPLLKSPKGRSDGGYAVADFRKVQPGTGHHGRSGASGRRLPGQGHQPVPGLCHEPHQRGP